MPLLLASAQENAIEWSAYWHPLSAAAWVTLGLMGVLGALVLAMVARLGRETAGDKQMNYNGNQ